MKISIFSLAIIFFLGCHPNPPAPQHFGYDAVALIKTKASKLTDSDIRIELKASKIKARQLDSVNGKDSVLSVPVEITNSSAQSISTNLAHEWYGGIWTPTDFYVAVQKTGSELDGDWRNGPAYQVGNLGTENKTVLKSGDKITVDIRLNWKGTGSVPTSALISENIPATYSIKFLLFFKTDLSEEYFISEELKVEVEK